MRLALIVAAAAVAVLAGCSEAPESTQAQPTAPIIAPGRPGEEARTLAPGEAVTAVPTPTANAADVRFMQDMVVHHRQALDMSALVPTRAASDDVKRFAARIKDVQGPEITIMITWLREQGQRVPDHHTLPHAGMPGMATPEQMKALAAASGSAFDRLYVEMMTAHHRGAITMSASVLEGGSHVRVQELADDIAVSQAVEINRMAALKL